jgi:hypothetical protein
VRAADLIGQLADINYLRNQTALFDEFRETGMSNKLGYNSVADLRANYPDFFWKAVRPYIGDALRYLRVTQEGQQWIANLYANVFSMEHRSQLLRWGYPLWIKARRTKPVCFTYSPSPNRGRIFVTTIRIPLLVVVALIGLGLAAPVEAQQDTMSFFVTSVGKGNGADLGGLAGADAHCQALAQAAGSTKTNWHAYLSATEPGGTAGVNARDRIGRGPWQNAKGVAVAKNVGGSPLRFQ